MRRYYSRQSNRDSSERQGGSKSRVENKTNPDNTWTSCCFIVNKNMVQYFTQVSIIVGIMIFAIYKLSTNETPEGQTIYMGLLTMMIGLALPGPIFKNK